MCFLPLEDLGDQLADARVDHRLAAADRDDRGAALVDRVEALLDRELLLDRRLVLADPAAAGAGQVAGVQRLEHQDQREPLGPRELLLGDVAGDPSWSSGSGNRRVSGDFLEARAPASRRTSGAVLDAEGAGGNGLGSQVDLRGAAVDSVAGRRGSDVERLGQGGDAACQGPGRLDGDAARRRLDSAPGPSGGSRSRYR